MQEDGRRPPALQAGHPRTSRKTYLKKYLNSSQNTWTHLAKTITTTTTTITTTLACNARPNDEYARRELVVLKLVEARHTMPDPSSETTVREWAARRAGCRLPPLCVRNFLCQTLKISKVSSRYGVVTIRPSGGQPPAGLLAARGLAARRA
jgi:hypothetical protein